MTTAITGATLIDGTGGDPARNATIIIEGERIVAAGAGVDPPRGADIIDAGGRTVMPGMIDAHVHFFGHLAPLQDRLLTPPSLELFHAAKNAKRTLDSGFTTVRDASGAPAGFKMAIERGLFPGPRMRISVVALSQTGGHIDQTMPSGVDPRDYSEGGFGPEWPRCVVDGPAAIRKTAREILRAGADVIKVCTSGGVLSPADEPWHTQFTVEEIAVMTYEAHAAGKTCMAHAHGTDGIKNAVRAGVESIEHGSYLDDEAIDLMLRNGTFLVPTMVASLWVQRYAQRDPASVLPQSARKAKETSARRAESFRAAVEAGVRVAMGTDSGVGPHGRNAEELALMVENGMTPMQAIVAATQSAAACLCMDREVGTLTTGKYADLLIVDGDPLEDIAMLQNRARLALIMQGGNIHKRDM